MTLDETIQQARRMIQLEFYNSRQKERLALHYAVQFLEFVALAPHSVVNLGDLDVYNYVSEGSVRISADSHAAIMWKHSRALISAGFFIYTDDSIRDLVTIHCSNIDENGEVYGTKILHRKDILVSAMLFRSMISTATSQ